MTEIPSLGDYVRILVRRKALIVLTTLFFFGGAVLYSALAAPLYQGTAQVLVNQRSAADAFDTTASVFTRDSNAARASRRASTEARFIESDPVRVAVAEKLNADVTIDAGR